MLEEIINHLEEKIDKSLSSSDLKEIFANLSEIKKPTILCGIGGSHVVSTFFEKVLTEKNNIIARNIDVEEYFLSDLNHYDNLVLISHRGKNHGIKNYLKLQKINIYLQLGKADFL